MSTVPSLPRCLDDHASISKMAAVLSRARTLDAELTGALLRQAGFPAADVARLLPHALVAERARRRALGVAAPAQTGDAA